MSFDDYIDLGVTPEELHSPIYEPTLTESGNTSDDVDCGNYMPAPSKLQAPDLLSKPKGRVSNQVNAMPDTDTVKRLNISIRTVYEREKCLDRSPLPYGDSVIKEFIDDNGE